MVLCWFLLVLFSVVNNVISSDIPIYSSCKDAYENACNNTSGEYRVKTQTNLGYSDVYCRMETYDECEGGGWTLAVKIKSDESTFVYNSSYWTNKESYNPSNGTNDNPNFETKLPTYWSTPLKKICLVNANSDETMVIDKYQARSLYHLIADGEYRPINITLECWKEFGGFYISTAACIEQGFNIGGNSTGDSRARLGILISTVQDECHQATHWVGVGVEDIDQDDLGQLLSVGSGYYGGSSFVPINIHIYVR